MPVNYNNNNNPNNNNNNNQYYRNNAPNQYGNGANNAPNQFGTGGNNSTYPDPMSGGPPRIVNPYEQFNNNNNNNMNGYGQQPPNRDPDVWDPPPRQNTTYS